MTLAILLVVGCLAVLVLEIFVVSFGVLTLVAVAMGVAGVLLAFEEGPVLGWSMVGVLFAGIPASLWGAFKLLPKLPFARGLHLDDPNLTERERHAAAQDFRSLLGAIGEVTAPLRPAGTAVFDGEPVDVVSNGPMVPLGARVRVLDVSGNRVMVEESTNRT